MNPDRLAELEAEQRFLLRSLADLEREHEAGDVDEIDYRELRDGYTVRAAATMRAIAEGRSALPVRPSANWRRRVVAGTAVLGAIGVVWWALAASSAERLPGQEITGLDPRSERRILIVQARGLQFERPADAAELYAKVLELDPLDVEALTYRGWTLALASRTAPDQASAVSMVGESVQSLLLAIETDPTYPDPFCFLGIVQFRFVGDAKAAQPLIAGCLASNPPADVRGLVESINADITVSLAEQGSAESTAAGE